jgi:hypothetical protein
MNPTPAKSCKYRTLMNSYKNVPARNTVRKYFDIHYLRPLPQFASLRGRWPRVNVYQLDLVTDKLYVMHMVLGDWVTVGIIKRNVIAGGQPGLQFAAIV